MQNLDVSTYERDVEFSKGQEIHKSLELTYIATRSNSFVSEIWKTTTMTKQINAVIFSKGTAFAVQEHF